MFPDRG